ncbi:hypothetical protein [Cupriavidus basilensis]|uniref:hypothetical protein n=1 Tax=Cupriavidus basilensis TaxID=68895 RepID=UPI000750D1EC|nr:hypothetical protein [Cupriavidus basilensis]
MTTLIKVVFKTTGGEETTALAALLRDGVVELPTSLMQRIQVALDAGDGYALAAHRRGYAFPLAHLDGARCTLDAEHVASEKWSRQLVDAFVQPSKDQLLASGRYCHTLSAACTVGLVGYVGGRPEWSITSITNCVCLLMGAAVLFAIGAIYSKGEK